MKHLFLVFVAMALCLSCGQRQKTDVAEKADSLHIPACVVTTPPDSLQLDRFYTKYVDVNGIPLVSSWRVPDSCFVSYAQSIARNERKPFAMLMLSPSGHLTNLRESRKIGLRKRLRSKKGGDGRDQSGAV